MAVTDIITFFLSIYFLGRGYLRGFLNSLMMPFSIMVGTIISAIYYQHTQNVLISLAIGLIGPLFLNLFLKYLLNMWTKATDTPTPHFLSSLVGAMLTLIWGWVFIIFTLILLVVLPLWGERLTTVHNDVKKSVSYSIIAKPWKEILFPTTAASGPDVKSLAQDPRFQAVMQDPEVQKEVDAHDFVKLMSNPKMMELTRQIMGDPATMKKVMAIYSSQAQSQSAK